MTTTSLMTFAEFEQMDDAPGKQELIDGELIEMPPARLNHMNISRRVYDHLRSGASGNLAYFETGYRIGRGWLQPDVSVTHSDQETDDGYLNGSPALAVEVLSPSTEAYDRGRKFGHYRQIESLQEYVLISQKEPLIETHRRNSDQTWTMTESGSLSASMTLASLGLTIPLAEIYDKVDFS